MDSIGGVPHSDRQRRSGTTAVLDVVGDRLDRDLVVDADKLRDAQVAIHRDRPDAVHELVEGKNLDPARRGLYRYAVLVEDTTRLQDANTALDAVVVASP